MPAVLKAIDRNPSSFKAYSQSAPSGQFLCPQQEHRSCSPPSASSPRRGNGGRLHHPPAGRGARRSPIASRSCATAICGVSAVADISDADLLAMIIGRTLEAHSRRSTRRTADEPPLLRVKGLSGHGFD